MQSDKKNLTTRSRRVLSVDATIAATTAEHKREEAADSLPPGSKAATFETFSESSSSGNVEGSQDLSNEQSQDQGKQSARSGQNKIFVPLVPSDCQDTNDRAEKIMKGLQRDRESRVHNHSLIIEDLKDLGMFGELSEDNDLSLIHISEPTRPY